VKPGWRHFIGVAAAPRENDMSFAGKTVMVTGGAGNLGRAVAEHFSGLGANLVLLDVTGRGDEKGLFIQTDLLDQKSVDAAVGQAISRFGRIDVLANIAGGFRMGKPVHETTDEDWNFLFDLNVRTVLHTARAVVPRMLAAGGGKIVNIGAFSAQKGAAQMAAYTASKSAVIRLTEAMAAELRDKGINVNCVLPTVIDTPQNRAAMPKADPKRWVAPQDLARTIAYLASDDARAVHGAALPVTGLS
jgi:NAD(P)-dependent dehydrogenase (short-subunit alcohol dehydrogenase family)